MNMRRAGILIGILMVAVVLAFPLREAVYAMVIVPAAYVIWVLGLLYHSVNQAFWWIVVLVLVLAIFSRSLLPQNRVRTKLKLKTKPVTGPVEELSHWMKKTNKGIYFKWLVANRLGRIAYQILLRRDAGKKRTVFEPLIGSGWEPSPEMQQYLEIGLHGSFADFPHGSDLFSRRMKTPLDQDVTETIEYLESQIKT